MHADTYRSSGQPRGGHPFPEEPPHRRAVEMAAAMQDIFALGNGVGFKDLLRAGFTSAEIIEHHEAADQLATEASVKRIGPAPDGMAEVKAKACSPVPNDPPRPRRTGEGQALFVAWRRYCAARQALAFDPWEGQRERCLALLGAALDHCDMFERPRGEVIEAVAKHLARVC